MPDPAKSVADIDDVLSSIRRLVAEQPGRGHEDETADSSGADDGAAANGQDKLLLTPALRVTQLDGEETGLADAAPEARDASETDRSRPKDTGAGPAASYAGPTGAPADSPEELAADDGSDLPATGRDSDVPTARDAQPQDSGMFSAATGLDLSDDPAPDALAGTRTEPSDGATKNAAESGRAVGSDGWRAEMRLYDWQTDEPRGEGMTRDPNGAMANYEPDTGDADWPDMGAHRALLEFAASRGAPSPAGHDAPDWEAAGANPSETDETSVDQPAPDAAASDAAPVFSRRTEAVSSLRVSVETPRPVRTGEVALNPFSAAAGSEVGGDDAVDWEDDAFAGIADNAEDLDPAAGVLAGRGIPEPVGTSADTGSDEGPPDLAGPEAPPPEAAAGLTSTGDRSVVAPFAEPPPGDDAPGDVAKGPDHEILDLAEPLIAPPEARIDDAKIGGAPRVWEAGLLGAGAAPAPFPEPSAAESAPPGTGYDGEASGATDLDEETLRRIVAEVVREELQGALGERITRNIRKLVRREIRLVLAADELD